MLFIQSRVETNITLAKPKSGAVKKATFDVPWGTSVSFPKSFIISIKGCKTGGPTRYCTLAVTLRSIQLARRPVLPSRRYAYREALHYELMTPGSVNEPLTAPEVIGILGRAARWMEN